MSVAVRFDPIRLDTLLDTAGLSPQQASATLADFAREQITAAEAQNAAALHKVPTHRTFVDGAENRPIEQVKPDGTIVALFDLTAELLEYIHDLLILAAPFRTGAFKRSIAIFIDGVQVDDLGAIGAAEEIVFTALVPYARKIERGESQQAPDGVFEAVAALAAGRFGNQARIRFTYREPMGGASALETWARGHSGGRRQQYSKDVRQPAIVVTFR